MKSKVRRVKTDSIEDFTLWRRNLKVEFKPLLGNNKARLIRGGEK